MIYIFVILQKKLELDHCWNNYLFNHLKGIVFSQKITVQLPNDFSRVGYLLDAIDCADPQLQAAMAQVRQDKTPVIGLRNNFNSDTSQAIKERCPWEPAPTCNPNLQFRSFDGSCNNLKNPSFGRTGTPYQRILLPEYAPGSLDLEPALLPLQLLHGRRGGRCLVPPVQ